MNMCALLSSYCLLNIRRVSTDIKMTCVENDVDDVEQVCLYNPAVDVPCLVLCSATIAVRDQE